MKKSGSPTDIQLFRSLRDLEKIMMIKINLYRELSIDCFMGKRMFSDME